jgi:heptosyltransferase-2
VFEAAPFIGECIPFHRKETHKGFTGMVKLAGDLHRGGYDEGILLTNSFSSAFLFYLAGLPKRVGYQGQWKTWMLTHPLKPMEPGTHQAVRYAHLLLDDTPEIMQPRIYLREEEVAQARERVEELGGSGRPVIAMAAGAAYGPAKRWEPGSYATLARRCVDECDALVLFLGSPAEESVIEEISQEAGEGAVNLAGKTSLRETFALLSISSAAVSNDSGLMHAAAAVDTPVIGLFGPTSYQETKPLGEHTVVLSKDLDCAPCFERTCPLEHHDCMKQLSVDEVFEVLKDFL